jgi:hypothetical protein
MIPMKTSSIFRSRWMALLWSAGIIWSALQFVGTADDGNGAEANVAGAAQALDRVG